MQYRYKTALFIESIRRHKQGHVEITATNGGHGGPPSYTWLTDSSTAKELKLGQRVMIEMNIDN